MYIYEQVYDTDPAHHPGYKTADIVALDLKYLLYGAVKEHRQQKQQEICMSLAACERGNEDPNAIADQYSCAPGTKGKLLPFVEERPVRSLVTHEGNG